MFGCSIKVVGLLNDITLLTECGLMIHWKESEPDRCL